MQKVDTIDETLLSRYFLIAFLAALTLILSAGFVLYLLHHFSWSGGLSEYSRQDQSENAALARADQVLLDAKRAGRSRTEVKAA